MKISKEILDIGEHIEGELKNIFCEIDKVRGQNFVKVLDAFQKASVHDVDFRDTSGYGYNDPGRDKVEEVYANIFKAESAIVCPQIVSGTHAISLALFGLLRPGKLLLYVTGEPYETGEGVIGIRKVEGSLAEYGVQFDQFDIRETFDREKISKAYVVAIQRSGGYSFKRSLTVEEIGEAIKCIKEINPEVCIMVDNCYGEFVEDFEPAEVGADVVVGSLIKNIGAGITPTGGYIVGKEKYLRKIEAILTAPGVGREIGPMLGLTRLFLQGVFFAPLVVSNAVKGAVFASRLFEEFGFEVKPRFYERRSDIVQAIKFGNPDMLIAFAQAIQNASPIDSDAEIEPSPLAGYGNKILMAAGTFVQGSSIELSADAPMKEPYVAYLQGGIYYEHSKLAALYSLEVLKSKFGI
jgi:cystathionine beta-lyase family protein involved in aluminum resistance